MRVLITVPSLAREFGGPAAKAAAVGGRSARGWRRRDRRRDAGEPRTGGASDSRPWRRFHTTPIPSRTSAIGRLVAGADVVHVLGFRDPVGTLAAFGSVRSGVPYVLEPVGMHERRVRSHRLKRVFDAVLGHRVVDRAALVMATSRLEADELVARGVDPDTIRLRPNGIEVEPLLPLPARGAFREAHGVPADAPLVLALGRITMKKGLPFLAEAVGGLDGAWLALVGPQEGDGTIEDVRAAARRSAPRNGSGSSRRGRGGRTRPPRSPTPTCSRCRRPPRTSATPRRRPPPSGVPVRRLRSVRGRGVAPARVVGGRAVRAGGAAARRDRAPAVARGPRGRPARGRRPSAGAVVGRDRRGPAGDLPRRPGGRTARVERR